MRVLITICGGLYATPYLKFYSEILDNAGIEYDVFYWDKRGNEIVDDERMIRFCGFSKNRITKVFGYLRFKQKLESILNTGKYDFIIPLGSYTWFIIGNKLVTQYKKRYILDIRDFSYENVSFYKKAEVKVSRNSAINVISSPGYTTFLPDGEYYVCHNLPNIEQCKKHIKPLSHRSPINIGFIGYIRFFNQNTRIIDLFGNDKRFRLYFIGAGANGLGDYCRKNNITNVVLEDQFDSEKTLDKYDTIDIVMNLYGNNDPQLDYALSNKLYLAAALHKPILVCPGTYMEKYSVENMFGYSFCLDDKKEKDRLYDYYMNIDYTVFSQYCDKFIEKMVEEQKTVIHKIGDCLKSSSTTE